MATIAETVEPSSPSLAPSRYERFLAYAALFLLVAVLVALAKGQPEWSHVPWQVWPHLGTILIALALTPVMLLRRRGDALHRMLGRVWAVAMFATAALSFNVRTINPGHFSLIHLLSLFTLVMVPVIWWAARTHRVALHRRVVRGMVTGALLIAGVFTFPFDRLLGHWLFG